MTKNCQSQYNPWLHYFALLTAIVTFLLLGLGGLVTSHEAGMSVPDWPNTYGYNMFLFPISKWVGGVYYEHTHRLLASVTGFLTVVLAVWMWISEPRRWLKKLGIWAVALVVVQGILGGLRVRWNMDELGIFHGTTAQVFFILVCAFALLTSRWWLALAVSDKWTPVPTGLRMHVLGTTILIFCQLMLGATMRHQHAGLSIPDFPKAYGKWWPDTSPEAVAAYNAQRMDVVAQKPITAAQIILQMIHRLAAGLILLAVVASVWRTVRQLGGRDMLAKVAVGWLLLICTQVGLGIATVLTNKAADIATLHVMVGALSLVTGALWCVIAFRRRVSATDSVTQSEPEPTVSGVLKQRMAMVGNK